MKKILSIALALALVLSVMSVSVLAAEKHPNKYDPSTNDVPAGSYWVVGEQGNPTPSSGNPLNNGISAGNFTEGNATADVKINFNNDNDTTNPAIPGEGGSNVGDGDAIEDRYAIDIVYQNLVIDLTDISNTIIDTQGTPETGDDTTLSESLVYVWDVNTHKYVVRKVVTDGSGNKTYQELGTDEVASKEAITIDAFQVINHSSLPIKYNAKFSKVATASSMTMALTYGSGDGDKIVADADGETTSYLTIERSRPKDDGTDGDAVPGFQHEIIAAPATDWLTTINTLAGQDIKTGAVIGSLLVTFSKVS